MSSTTTPSSRPRSDFWCHQCMTEIRPLMVPYPLCPHCHGEFVEKIEEGVSSDPRDFVEQEENEGDEGGGTGLELPSSVSVDEMVELLSYVLSPMSTTTTTTTTTTTGRRSTRQSSGRSRRDAQSLSHDGTEERGLGQQLPGQFPRSRSLPRTSSAPTSTGTTRAVIEITNIIEDEDIEMTDANLETEQQDGEEQQQEQQIQLPPIQAAQSLASLLEYFGIGPPLSTGSEVDGSFNPFGNLGDYVFSQSALDNIITQLMDAETRRDGPVAASDEVIESIPRHTLTQDELDAKTECSVCKDEFAKDDQCLQLKCKHIFHNDCIKPWLKTSGTCPTCRYAVVPQERPQDNEEESDDDDEEDDDDNNLRTPYHRRLASYSTRDRYGSSAATGAGSSLPGSFPTL